MVKKRCVKIRHVFRCALFLIILEFQVSQVVSAWTNPYDNEGKEEAYFKMDKWDPPKDMKDDFQYYHSGYDDDGRPVWYVPMSKWNYIKLSKQSDEKFQEFEKLIEQFYYRIYNSPKYANYSTESGKHETIHSFVLIADMNDYDLKQIFNLKALQLSIKALEKLEIAAETMEYGFVINTNYVAERFLNSLKPILGKLISKVNIWGTWMEKWLPEVIKKIPRDSLPLEMGGTKNCSKAFGKCLS